MSRLLRSMVTCAACADRAAAAAEEEEEEAEASCIFIFAGRWGWWCAEREGGVRGRKTDDEKTEFSSSLLSFLLGKSAHLHGAIRRLLRLRLV